MATRPYSRLHGILDVEVNNEDCELHIDHHNSSEYIPLDTLPRSSLSQAQTSQPIVDTHAGATVPDAVPTCCTTNYGLTNYSAATAEQIIVEPTSLQESPPTIKRAPATFGASVAQLLTDTLATPSRFKVSLPVRSSTNNMLPWTATGRPRDSQEVQLLLDLARLMAEWGAPLYRVETRIVSAAEALEIPISFFSLPSLLMINIGDGGAQHPSRTVFIPLEGTLNMWKLYQADRLARRLGLIHIRFEKLKMRVLNKQHHKESTHETDRNGSVANPIRQSVYTSSPISIPSLSRNNAARKSSLNLNGSTNASGWNSHHGEGRSSTASRIMGRSDEEPIVIEEIIQDLNDLISQDGEYSNLARVASSFAQSGIIVILLFGGSLADAIAASVLGALATVISIAAEELEMQTVSIIFVAGVVAFFSRIAQTKYIWSAFPGSEFGLCHDIVSLAGLVQFMPGMQFTLAMLELGSNYTVACAVRLFQACMRSIMVGYGATFGSRLAVTVLQMFEAWGVDDTLRACPSPDQPYSVDWWRLPMFIPMTFSIMILLKAHKDQWLFMAVSSLVGFVVSTIARFFLTLEMASALTAFSLGIVSNILARYRDNIAIASVLAGIFWLVPGSVGVRGAIAAFSGNAPASAFGTEVIVRAMSIAVGLL
ncbi:hypothetical protein BSLG_009232 [Batrachochytrium salamandrivorans]|nr:hypothetical protein BSLG_009232 [Batrachochytrium salamandrivorans]